jgi:uncharacterized RmlC-like cupin family protein
MSSPRISKAESGPWDDERDAPLENAHAEALFLRPGVSHVMERIDVLRVNELPPGDSTPGISRNSAFDAEGITVGRTEMWGGASSGWHHHGERHVYGFLVSGRLHLEYGPGGTRTVEVSCGDFFHIPPRLVHRDVNPSRDDTVVVVNIIAGGGPAVINVDGPDPL